EGGAGVHSRRSRGADRKNQVVGAVAAPADLDFRRWEISDRSDLVVLFILGAGFSATQAWAGVDENRRADHDDLFDFGYWQRGRWVAFFEIDSARQKRHCRA